MVLRKDYHRKYEAEDPPPVEPLDVKITEKD